ncbi:MAG: lipopolysaccharide assembly protein LapA domain-containing protein [Pseudomonadota bacterium]
MLRRIGIVAVVLVVFVVMVWFTSINPGVVSIDLAFGTVEPTIPLALSVTFVLGWLFGVLCASIYVLRLLNERRRLRASLRTSESEVSSLRNLPIADAD